MRRVHFDTQHRNLQLWRRVCLVVEYLYRMVHKDEMVHNDEMVHKDEPIHLC